MDFLWVCVLIYLLPVVSPLDVYHQTPSSQVLSVGSTFKVDCHTGWLPGGKVNWYKRQHQEHLQFVYSVMEYTPPAGRLSGQVNAESTIYSLIVNDVQRNDSGWYYCSAKSSTEEPFVFGNGTKLVITGSPRIVLLTPPMTEIRRVKTVQLMCLVQNVDVDAHIILWSVSGRNIEGRVDSGTIDRDGTQSFRSQIGIPVETWRSGAVCTCALRVNATENFIADSVFPRKDPPSLNICLLLYYAGFPVAIVILFMVIFAVGRSCKNRQSGRKSGRMNFAEVRTRAAGNDTTYATLAFNDDTRARGQREGRISLPRYSLQ
ncbi:uncharacterized protein LOC132398873 [Hypanus sabinus]|uniref:uncharacterized protein LOC132398873 n=1 Tax=Hypanus sabinus TaxID=79690 RepID=UPI0028C4972A|nr:uncharacterized protein LOC132398873 [Hypanus sabinus]